MKNDIIIGMAIFIRSGRTGMVPILFSVCPVSFFSIDNLCFNVTILSKKQKKCMHLPAKKSIPVYGMPCFLSG